MHSRYHLHRDLLVRSPSSVGYQVLVSSGQVQVGVIGSSGGLVELRERVQQHFLNIYNFGL